MKIKLISYFRIFYLVCFTPNHPSVSHRRWMMPFYSVTSQTLQCRKRVLYNLQPCFSQLGLCLSNPYNHVLGWQFLKHQWLCMPISWNIPVNLKYSSCRGEMASTFFHFCSISFHKFVFLYRPISFSHSIAETKSSKHF